MVITFVVLLLIAVALLLALAAIRPLCAALSMMQSTSWRGTWLALNGFAILFFFGYAGYVWRRLGTTLTLDDILVTVVLFVGSCFVLAAALLSRETARDVLRLADLERDALLDPLTGLFNRRYLDARLGEEVARAHRHGLALSIVLMDIDHFKRVNDGFGHQVGDEVLRQTCRLVERLTRPADTATRYGGEEMLILAPDTDLNGARRLAESLRTVVGQEVIALDDGTRLSLTASIGVASLQAADTTATLIRRADRALYAAKAAGRNRVCIEPPNRLQAVA